RVLPISGTTVSALRVRALANPRRCAAVAKTRENQYQPREQHDNRCRDGAFVGDVVEQSLGGAATKNWIALRHPRRCLLHISEWLLPHTRGIRAECAVICPH